MEREKLFKKSLHREGSHLGGPILLCPQTSSGTFSKLFFCLLILCLHGIYSFDGLPTTRLGCFLSCATSVGVDCCYVTNLIWEWVFMQSLVCKKHNQQLQDCLPLHNTKHLRNTPSFPQQVTLNRLLAVH